MCRSIRHRGTRTTHIPSEVIPIETIATLLGELFDHRHELVGEGGQLLAMDGPSDYLLGYADGQLDEVDRHIVRLGEYPLATVLSEEEA